MQLELSFSNEARVLPGIRAFVHETLQQVPLEASLGQKLAAFVLATIRDAIEHAYPDGQEGSIKLLIQLAHGRLEVLVRDFGIPQDIRVLEQRLYRQGGGAPGSFEHPGSDVVDEVHWLSFGAEGKALQLIKWLHSTHIERAAAATLSSFSEQPPLAPQQRYTIRRMLPEEAVQVSQLMYRAYGGTYFNRDVYYPDRVAAQNARNAVLSFVALGEDGKIAGHYALELNQDGPVAEGGQAVVDPAHRGRGLLDRMKEAALKEASRLDLVGWYADAVTVHTLTQKSDVTHGCHLTGVDLAIAPKTESFRQIAERLPQRLTCLLYFHWLKPPLGRTVHVPGRHRAIVAEIYERLECPIQFGDGGIPSGHTGLAVKNNTGAANAFIRLGDLGEDTVRLVSHAKRKLVERKHSETVYVDLPLADAAAVYVAEELEKEGFGFAGVLPHFSPHGDLLRLAYLVEPLSRGPIKTLDEFSGRVVDYALAEQRRVRGAL